MSRNPLIARVCGSAAVAAVAVTSLAAVGTAAAAPVQIAWDDGNTHFVRTVSNPAPRVGDLVTIRTAFSRKWIDEYVHSVKETVDGCLDYVESSGVWIGQAAPKSITVTPGTAGGATSVQLNGSWLVPGLGSKPGEARTVTFQFKVTSRCTVGKTMKTGLRYTGSLGNGVYDDKGPTMTVAAPAVIGGDGGSGGAPGGGSVGGSGSVGSLFG